MSKKVITIALMLVAMCTVFITGCYKVTTLTVPDNKEVTTPVSFKDDLIPIFATNCAVSGCHNSGGIKPDLTPEKAYTSLITGDYVDTESPEKSKIYLFLTGELTPKMPIGATDNPSNINNLVLAWIKQGAKNN